MSDNEIYFAAREANETVNVLLAKANVWFRNLDTTGYLDKLRQMWAAYHGAYYSNMQNGHKITFSGEQGEFANLPVNHFRNIAQNILVMITAQRPVMEARSINTDYKSLVQTKLANGLLDYYMREKRLERYLKTAVEYAVVLGAGYVKMEWNATGGEIYDHIDAEVDPVTGEVINQGYPVYEGDVQFSNLSPFDVVVDSTKENQDHDWVLCRSYKNKFDLAAKYPELKDKILQIPTKEEYDKYRFNTLGIYETDDVPVYEFFHKRTEAMPEGRYLLFLDYDLTLMDAPMPYDVLPIYRISCGDIIGTPFGYTPMFDLLPIQDAVNSLFSTILSNQSAFGVQNILMPRGTDIVPSNLVGGLNLIEYNPQAGKPESLNLTQTPKEVFEFAEMLIKEMEVISGVNSVARGNPDPQLKSGNALALIQSMALQYMSGLQHSYVQLIEDTGTGMIKMLQRFASVPRITMIVGNTNRTEMKEFTGEDLSSINRVIVDVGNYLARCLKKDTEVLMYDGSIKMVQDIQIGDLVMGPDSKPRTVHSINIGEEEMYDIHHKHRADHFIYGCNESHILSLMYCSDDGRHGLKKGQVVDMSVKEYLSLPKRTQRLFLGFRTSINFDKKETTVPPYILGLWLGDGHSANTTLTSMDEELINSWYDYAKELNLEVKDYDNKDSLARMYRITSGEAHGSADRNKFQSYLRDLNLINNKHIPKNYLTSDRNDRLSLLAGFIDTDGSLHVDGGFHIVQKNERLTQDVVFLARSLGFKVKLSKVDSDCGPTKDRSLRYKVGECNRIYISGPTWEIPTKLSRKQAPKKDLSKIRNHLTYGINIKAVGRGTFYGFSLKEEPHFVLGDFTVTHNTTAGRVEMAEQMLQMGLIKTPEQYLTVINTGRLDAMTEDTQSELLLIKAENERLISGEQVMAVATDQHSMHIKEHKSVLADPDLRKDPMLVQRTLMHIQEHINMLRTLDPQLLAMMGEQSLAPMMPPQGAPGQEQAPPPAPSGDQGGQTQVQETPLAQEANVNMPAPAQPPAPFADLPVQASDMPLQ